MSATAPRSLLVLAVAAAIAGCGDDTEEVSAEELVSRADELCREGRERFAEIQAEAPQSAEEALEQTEELVDSAAEELDELERLQPPGDVSDDYDRYLATRSEALDLLERGRDAAADGDAAAYAEAQTKLEAGRRERARLARALGFRNCSRD